MPEITIAGQLFEIADRYSEGHPLTAGEAAALNQTFRENIRNNFASAVREAREVKDAEGKVVEGETRELTDADIEDLQARVAEYAAAYQFGVRTSGGVRTPADPVEREALKLAGAAIRAKLKEANKKMDAADIAALAEQLVEKNPEYKEAARARIEAAKAIGDVSLAGLDL